MGPHRGSARLQPVHGARNTVNHHTMRVVGPCLGSVVRPIMWPCHGRDLGSNPSPGVSPFMGLSNGFTPERSAQNSR